MLRFLPILGRSAAPASSRIVADVADNAPVLMIGTDPDGTGAIASAIRVLAADGLFERESVHYLISHREGARSQTAIAALLAFGATLWACLVERPAVVHVHVAAGASFARKSILLLLARAAGCRTICHLHDAGFDRLADAPSGVPMCWWSRYTLERSSVVIARSASQAVFLHGVAPAARLVVVFSPATLPAQLSVLYRELRR
jgi:hypothetical protein